MWSDGQWFLKLLCFVPVAVHGFSQFVQDTAQPQL